MIIVDGIQSSQDNAAINPLLYLKEKKQKATRTDISGHFKDPSMKIKEIEEEQI